MKQTLLVKLTPTPEEHASLLRTLEAFNAACNAIADVAFAHRLANKVELQKLVYYDIRQQFGLSAQMVIRAIAKVAEAYKRDKRIKPAFRPHGAMIYDERIMNFPTADRVSLLTLDGRVDVPFRFGAYAAGMPQRRRGQADLLYRKRSNTFFLAVTVDAPEPTPDEANDYLGVDLGVIALAATSDGEFLNHSTGPKHAKQAHINQARARYSRFRAKLQKKGTKSAKRLLRKRSGREKRFSRDVNHCISKALVRRERLSASGECCIVGRSSSCAPSSPTRRHWRVCRWSTSTQPTPARRVAAVGIARRPIARLKLISCAGPAGSPPMPI